MSGKVSATTMATAEEEEKSVTMTGKDSTTTMAAAAAEAEEKSATKVFSMFHLDNGLIILEEGKRMPSEIYANESITEETERLESENQQLEDMLRSLQTTIAKVSEDLKAKREKHMEVLSRQRENPEVIKMHAACVKFVEMEEAAIAGKKQMELDEIKHGQELTRHKISSKKDNILWAISDRRDIQPNLHLGNLLLLCVSDLNREVLFRGKLVQWKHLSELKCSIKSLSYYALRTVVIGVMP